MKFRWFTAKTNAMKEIEAWAKEGDLGNPALSHTTARASGQLNDNVTEARMLQSKILDLSKERYKFLSQNSYEKKSFLDKQKRKAPVLRFLLQEVNIESRKFYLPINNKENNNNNHNNNKSSGLKSRLTFAESPTMAKSVRYETPADMQKSVRVTRYDRPNTTGMPAVTSRSAWSDRSREITRTAPPTLPVVFPTEPRINKDTQRLSDNHHCYDDGKLPRMTTFAGLPEPGKLLTTPSPRMSPSPRPRSRYSSRSKRSGGTRSARSLPTADPRYRELEKLLCENYDIEEEKKEVAVIVKGIESLHMPPRKPKQPKPRMAMKIQQFMKERGIAF